MVDEIRDIIGDVIQNIADKKNNEGHKIERIAETILGEKEKTHITFSGMKDDKVLFLVDNSSWLYHFKMNRIRILKRLQEECPEIDNIIFKIGKNA